MKKFFRIFLKYYEKKFSSCNSKFHSLHPILIHTTHIPQYYQKKFINTYYTHTTHIPQYYENFFWNILKIL